MRFVNIKLVEAVFATPQNYRPSAKKGRLHSRGEQMFLNETEFADKLVVLCVDDEADGLFLRAQILERFGYAVIASTHPLLALDIVCDQTIDAALLDYHMPQMNGAELSAKIREKAPSVKIIMLSGCSDIPESDLACVDSFVPKCEGMTQLLKVLSSLKAADRLPGVERQSFQRDSDMHHVSAGN